MKSTHTGLKRISMAFKYSYDGFIAAFKSEAAFRQDLIVFIFLTPVAFILPVDVMAKGLMISSLILILLMELINTAIETVVDRLGDDYHILSKKAKDIGSLIVLISFINALLIWAAILIQYGKFFI